MPDTGVSGAAQGDRAVSVSDMERLVRGVGDPLIPLLRPGSRGRGDAAADLPLEPVLRAVLAWLIEEVKADPRAAGKGPAEVLDCCAAVLGRVREYVREAVREDGARGGGRRG